MYDFNVFESNQKFNVLMDCIYIVREGNMNFPLLKNPRKKS